MEGRIWGMLAAFLFVVVLGGSVAYMVGFEEVRREYFNLQNQIETLEKTIKSRQVVLDARMEKAKSIAAQNARVTDLERKILELDAAKAQLLAGIDQQTAAAAAASKELVDTVELVRKKASGMLLPEMKLPSGEILQGVRIQTVTDADVSVLHSLGVSRLLPKQVPQDLASKFRFGFVASHAPPPAAKSDTSSDSASPSPSGQPVAADAVAASKADAARAEAEKAANQRKIRELKDRTAKLDSQMTVVRGNRDIWRKKADEYTKLHSEAEAKGRINSYLIKAREAAEIADQFEIQITNLRAQIQLLQHETVSLMKSSEPNG